MRTTRRSRRVTFGLVAGAVMGLAWAGLQVGAVRSAPVLRWDDRAGQDQPARPAPCSPVVATIALGAPGVPLALRGLAVDATRGRAFVSEDQGTTGSVAVLDLATGALHRLIPVAEAPGRLTLDATTGRLYLVHAARGGPGRLSILDTRRLSVLQSIPLPHGGSPRAVVVDAHTQHVFVVGANTSLDQPGRVSMLAMPSGRVVRTVPVGSFPDAPVVDDATGRVFVLSHGRLAQPGAVNMLDARTGMLLRVIAVGALPQDLALDVQAGRVVATASDSLSLLDAGNGGVVRRLRGGHSAVVVDATIGRALANGAGRVDVLDTVTGTVQATTPLQARVTAVDEATGRVFAVAPGPGSTGAGHVVVLDASSGAVLQSAAVGPRPLAMAVDGVTGRSVVIDGVDNTVRLLDARFGRGRAPAGQCGRPTPAATPTPVGTTGSLVRRVRIPTGALALDGRRERVVVLGPSQALASVLDARSGALLHTVRGLGQDPSAVAIDQRRGLAFIICRGASTLSVLDERLGTIRRTVPVAPGPLAVAVDARTGRVFVASDESDTVRVLDEMSGATIATLAMKGPEAIAVDERTGRVFVAGSDPINPGPGQVSMLDARTGRRLSTVTVGRQPDGVVADEQTGHVFVGSSGHIGLSMLDATTGRVLRTIPVAGYGFLIAVDPHSGYVFVPTFNREQVLDGHSGALVLHSADLGPYVIASSPAFDTPRQRAYILGRSQLDKNGAAIGPSYASVIDTTTGVLLHKVPIGPLSTFAPHSIALDEQSGLVFVADDEGVAVIDGARL